MEHGFTFNGKRNHPKRDLIIRRIRFSPNLCYTILPSFVMPYSMVLTKDVEHGFLLRQWNVSYEIIALIFGRDAMFWYRLELSFLRHSIVGTTVKTAPIPANLLAEEHHEKLGKKKFILLQLSAKVAYWEVSFATVLRVAIGNKVMRFSKMRHWQWMRITNRKPSTPTAGTEPNMLGQCCFRQL
jgi:hypothetical protein